MAQRYLNKFQDVSAYNSFRTGTEYTTPSVSYCVGDNTVMFDLALPSHEYVDLGLPSGTLWATCNIGAETPYDVGLYFAWGETTGYTVAQLGVDKYFNKDDYRFYDSVSNELTKYYPATYGGDGKVVMEAEDDAATANWGSNWCTPTMTQIEELFYYTTQEYDSSNNGIIFESTENGNTLFIPIGNIAYRGYIRTYTSVGPGNDAVLLRSSYRSKCANFNDWAQAAVCDYNLNIIWQNDTNDESGVSRYYGIPVRPVRTGFVDDPENIPPDDEECWK